MIEIGEGRTEFINITTNTCLVTKHFGKDPHSREGIFPLKMSILAMVSCRPLGHVSESGHLFTDGCKAPVGTVEGHSRPDVSTRSFHGNRCVCPSAPIKAFVPAFSARLVPIAEVSLNSVYDPGIEVSLHACPSALPLHWR